MSDKIKTSKQSDNLFELALEQELADPAFRAGFERKLAKITAIAELLTSIEASRAKQQIPKAEVARRIDRRPEAISRLLSGRDQNPTLDTIADLAYALGLEIEVRIKERPKRARLVPRPISVHATV
jgi:transcriptional regulator with XRE-family HTH domain